MKRIVITCAFLFVCAMGASAVTQPSAISNLAFWVRADAGVTTNASGKVTAWADQSGRGNNATGNVTYPPDIAYGVSDLNGKPTLRFNGTNQNLTVANRILTNGVEAFTIIAMAKADINNNPSIVGIRSGSGPFVQLDQDANGYPRFIVRHSAGSITATATGTKTHTGTYGMYAGRLLKGSATSWTNHVYFSSTAAEGLGTANFSTDAYLTSGNQYIGSTSVAFWDGDIAEVMIYDRALSASEMSDLEVYLASRYKPNRTGASVRALNDIPGLAMWLRADSCVYKDPYANDAAKPSDTVALWGDSSAGTHDAVNLAAPSFATNVVNGLPAIAMSSSRNDRFFLRDNPISTNPAQLVVFAVLRQTTGVTAQAMILTHRNTATPLVQASVQDGTNALLQMRGSGGGAVQMITATGLLTNGTFNLVMYQFDAVNDRHVVVVNGGAEVVNTYDFGSQTFVADTQRIGCYNAGGGDGLLFGGYIAELIVYEGVALSRTQKNKIGFYLESKYGLDTGYVPSGTVLVVQ